MRKIELFFRGESWLHFATMFFFMQLIFRIFGVNWWMLIIPVVIAIVWELWWKYKRGNPIDLVDIISTVLGGLAAFLII